MVGKQALQQSAAREQVSQPAAIDDSRVRDAPTLFGLIVARATWWTELPFQAFRPALTLCASCVLGPGETSVEQIARRAADRCIYGTAMPLAPSVSSVNSISTNPVAADNNRGNAALRPMDVGSGNLAHALGGCRHQMNFTCESLRVLKYWQYAVLVNRRDVARSLNATVIELPGYAVHNSASKH